MSRVTPADSLCKIQSILANKGEIVFTKGVYLISAPLLFYSNSSIVLEKGAVLRQAGKIEHILLSKSTKKTTGYNGTHDVIIEGEGMIEGMGKYNVSLNLLTLCHCEGITIEGITLQDAQGFHALEINSSKCVKVKQTTFAGYRSYLGACEFREAIQIDSACESALVVAPTGSRWYDGTVCEDIEITDCIFEASKSRPAFSRCVGNHCQTTKNHKNILIRGNQFIGSNQENVNGAALSIIGMDNVRVEDNDCTRYGRFAKIYRQNYTYLPNGDKVTADKTDGVCHDICFKDNNIKSPIGTVKNHGIYINGKHKNIIK